MKALVQLSVFLLFISGIGLYLGGCVHEPDMITSGPVDTTSNQVDTNAIDTTTHPCNPNVIYFEKQILPMLLSGCALAGCHDPNSSKDGVVLNSFDNVIKTVDIKAFKPGGSKLYEKITTSDLKDRMPPPPNECFIIGSTKLISDWILQGATSVTCDQPTTCNTIAMSFTTDVMPLISMNCKVCH